MALRMKVWENFKYYITKNAVIYTGQIIIGH
jgi:hypothetical protein